MKFHTFLLVGLVFLLPVETQAAENKIKDDKITIGYIPAKYAFHKGEPTIVLEAKTLAHHHNKDIGGFFEALSKLASEGVTDNATEFHQPTVYLNAVYQGKSITLYNSGESKLEKFKHYEQEWTRLHRSIYSYLIKKIAPDK